MVTLLLKEERKGTRKLSTKICYSKIFPLFYGQIKAFYKSCLSIIESTTQMNAIKCWREGRGERKATKNSYKVHQIFKDQKFHYALYVIVLEDFV